MCTCVVISCEFFFSNSHRFENEHKPISKLVLLYAHTHEAYELDLFLVSVSPNLSVAIYSFRIWPTILSFYFIVFVCVCTDDADDDDRSIYDSVGYAQFLC